MNWVIIFYSTKWAFGITNLSQLSICQYDEALKFTTIIGIFFFIARDIAPALTECLGPLGPSGVISRLSPLFNTLRDSMIADIAPLLVEPLTGSILKNKRTLDIKSPSLCFDIIADVFLLLYISLYT